MTWGLKSPANKSAKAGAITFQEVITMAMVIKNNMSAKNTLNQLNKNNKALEKSLAKVSSGMRINNRLVDRKSVV